MQCPSYNCHGFLLSHAILLMLRSKAAMRREDRAVDLERVLSHVLCDLVYTEISLSSSGVTVG